MALSAPTQAVILAGGKGSRLGNLTETVPKPMIRFHGRPFIHYLLNQIKSQGIEEVLILTGYLGDQIEGFCGDGSEWGLNIKVKESPVEYETGWRLKDAYHQLHSKFLMMYCDNYWPMQISDMSYELQLSGARALVTVYRNRDGYTKDNVRMDQNGYVSVYDPTRTASNLSGVDLGYAIIPRDLLDDMCEQNLSFSHAVYPGLAKQGLLKGYVTNHRYYSIGSRERLPVTELFLKPQRALILDRDGTLNKRPPVGEYVRSWDEFEWLPGAIQGMRLLKNAGYKLILASNQSGIARGLMTEADLHLIHDNMRRDLSANHVSLDAIYYCPHGWDDGCECRKPLPGMLFQAQTDFHLDLTNTMFIGDDPRDEQTGKAAGCLTDIVSSQRSFLEITKQYLSAQQGFN